jgi:hypothetical protein
MENLSLRFYNFLTDSLIIFVSFFLIIVIFKGVIPEKSVKLYASVYYIFYYFTFEYFLNKTPGKFITKTQVIVQNDKNKALSILIRSIVRLIPLDIFSFLVLETGLHDKFSYSKITKNN